MSVLGRSDAHAWHSGALCVYTCTTCLCLSVEDKPSNMELRQRCMVTMQKNEQAMEHSVSEVMLLYCDKIHPWHRKCTFVLLIIYFLPSSGRLFP